MRTSMICGAGIAATIELAWRGYVAVAVVTLALVCGVLLYKIHHLEQ